MRQEKLAIIPDTHGHAAETEQLLGKLRDRGYLEEYRLLFLGDYFDRGPAIKQLVEMVIDLKTQGHIMLAGNHELALYQALDQTNPNRDYWANHWINNYQDQTLASYGIDTPYDQPAIDLADRLREQMPPSHFRFLASLPWIYENEQLVAVHAGLDPDLDFQKQVADLSSKNIDNPKGPQQLFSHRLARLSRDLGKLVVSGHSSLEEPHLEPHRAMINCGVDAGGRLIAYLSDSGEIVS